MRICSDAAIFDLPFTIFFTLRKVATESLLRILAAQFGELVFHDPYLAIVAHSHVRDDKNDIACVANVLRSDFSVKNSVKARKI